MNEQQPIETGTSSTEATGMDRRKFLLRTTAITAGAWAAPSILTIDRAFGAPGSPDPCTDCGPNTETDGATVKGLVVAPLTGTEIPIRLNACLNDDDLGVGPVLLPEGLGTVDVLAGGCAACGANIQTGVVNLLVAGTPITAEALHANAACNCAGEATGGSTVYNVQVGALGPFNSNTYEFIDLGPLGYVALNESPGTATGTPGEFTAMHIVISDPIAGGSVDLKLASAKVTCA